RRQSEKQNGNWVQSCMMTAFGGGSACMSGGHLGNSRVSPDYETDLIVEYTPYSYEPVYLKAFLGLAYDGERWIPPEELGVEADLLTSETLDGLQDLTAYGGTGKMSVTNVGADANYSYYPYYTDPEATGKNDAGGELYTFYPYRKLVQADTKGVSEQYLEVSQRCLEAVADICAEQSFVGDEETIAAQVVEFFEENYFYTLNPGYIWNGEDYIVHFLKNSKRGYCMHFASAATMMFRYLGIPARYVEGYVFSYGDVLVDGKLVEDADYADYYSGYSELGETGVIRLEIPDANAHAWVEIYVEGKGWIVVDPTPASSEEEESENFWDAFQQRNRELSAEGGLLGGNATVYLGRVVDSAVWILTAIAVFFMLILVVRYLYGVHRERKLPPRERVCNLYRKIVAKQARKLPELSKAQTIGQQLTVLDASSVGNESWKALEAALYRTFYGTEMTTEEYEKLYETLKRL
ncbi:MAG: transglutaminase domain-containing protein, partial [Lachnospiraceae bacterium]|nr:transglutaminase domain-containing protein [Lachnospiraceae bacterium]